MTSILVMSGHEQTQHVRIGAAFVRAVFFKKDMKLNAWVLVAGLSYGITRTLLNRNPEWSEFLRAAVALVPLIPLLYYVRSCLRFVRGMDELQWRLQLEAWLFAALGTVFVSAALGALNANGVDLGRFRHGLDIGATFALTIVFWIVGSILANRRYK